MTDIYAAYWQGNSVPSRPSLSTGSKGRTYRAPGGPLALTIGPFSAAYSHRIRQTKPEQRTLFDYGTARNGVTYDLGEYAEGTEVEFAIDVQNTGSTYLTSGPAVHGWTSADASTVSTGMMLFGLEDQYDQGGGDQDHDDMLLYVNNAGTGGVRRWNGSSWTNLTKGLGDVIRSRGSGQSRWFITDMYFIDNKLWVLWWDDYRDISGAAVYTGTGWNILWSEQGGYTYTGFVCWKNQAHIYGFSSGNRFTIWKVQGMGKVLVGTDPGNWSFYHALRGCVITNPANANELVVGDAHNDAFAYVDMVAKTFTAGSRPGGSCVFALGIDNYKHIWAGDYGNLFYWTQDGHTWTNDLYASGYPELWEMRRWKNNLWGVGCNPCSIISRTATAPGTSLAANWTREYVSTTLPQDEGMGFMSMQETAEGIYVGFGGEPYYYNRTVRQYNTRATVYHWDGTNLRDIGAGQDWGDGVIATISGQRSCRPGLLVGAPGDKGIHMDPKADIAGRGLAGGR